MQLDDVKISRAIIDNYFKKLLSCLEVDVALVGAGPANLVCGTLLGRAGIKTALFESKLAPGGGMWGGGMMFNEIVIQETALPLLQKMNVRTQAYEKGYFTADSVECVSTLISACVRAGTPIFNLVRVVDVMFREQQGQKRVNGLVLQWAPVEHAGLHVDPLTIRARYTVDGSGHPAEVCSIVSRKMDAKLNTASGQVMGEMSMWADRGEELTIVNTGEIFPGLFVAGMAANAAMGAPRMGPVFGGMLLSGEKAAGELLKKLR
ncbi:MAG: sulfide-dependent adenosine diphosphate thiazole synthase [Thermodesulfovibrionales bacterium]|nr:sulfide-dependent adenosine diphosphate thiazole synthase [Thermodesulfovibrionales bacterium]